MYHDLVVFGEDWGGHPSSTQHLMRRMSAERDVVWVNSIGLRRPRLTRRDLGRVVAKVRAVARGALPDRRVSTPTPARLSLVNPRAISWPGSALAQMFNRGSLGRQLRETLRQRRMRQPVLWSSLPSAVSVVGGLDERAVVYYCGDDFSALTGVDHGAVAAMERALVARADLIFAASEELAARFPAGRTVLLPHGVDFDLFAQPVKRAADLPDDRPVAGFYGSIAEWIDVDMLAMTARALPHWRFVLIGDVRTDVSALAAQPNVLLMGPRGHEALPTYSQHWTVSLLPFRDTPQIRACNPLKLREYLAAGAPIAATDFPALAPYRDLISVAGDRNCFAEAIRHAASQGADLALRRRRVVDESWEARARVAADLIDAL